MSLNVLVVDDSGVMRAMVARMLRMSGLDIGAIREAANGAEALDALRACPADLALVDINMPVMNGEELVERVRSDPMLRSLPIVVVSTDRSEARSRTLRARGAELVRKPFTPEDLRRSVLRVVRVPR